MEEVLFLPSNDYVLGTLGSGYEDLFGSVDDAGVSTEQTLGLECILRRSLILKATMSMLPRLLPWACRNRLMLNLQLMQSLRRTNAAWIRHV